MVTREQDADAAPENKMLGPAPENKVDAPAREIGKQVRQSRRRFRIKE